MKHRLAKDKNVKRFLFREKIARDGGPKSSTRPEFNLSVRAVDSVSHLVSAGGLQWYPPVMIGAETVQACLYNRDYVARAIDLMRRLSPDEYTTFLIEFLSDGQRRFGADWRYADIVTVLMCLSELLRPKSYLEIGVRRGRSVAAVSSASPNCKLHMFDMWVAQYAGMENPGPNFVRRELIGIGHVGEMIFVNGDSHATLPAYFAENPDATFDLITVDGDHSVDGAIQDLCDVLPRLNVGGAVVLDDVCHPLHPELAKIWSEIVVSDPRFSSFTFSDTGYGVGFAIRKH
jgi:predicted O-methyltransferase YrrM